MMKTAVVLMLQLLILARNRPFSSVGAIKPPIDEGVRHGAIKASSAVREEKAKLASLKKMKLELEKSRKAAAQKAAEEERKLATVTAERMKEEAARLAASKEAREVEAKLAQLRKVREETEKAHAELKENVSAEKVKKVVNKLKRARGQSSSSDVWSVQALVQAVADFLADVELLGLYPAIGVALGSVEFIYVVASVATVGIVIAIFAVMAGYASKTAKRPDEAAAEAAAEPSAALTSDDRHRARSWEPIIIKSVATGSNVPVIAVVEYIAPAVPSDTVPESSSSSVAAAANEDSIVENGASASEGPRVADPGKITSIVPRMMKFTKVLYGKQQSVVRNLESGDVVTIQIIDGTAPNAVTKKYISAPAEGKLELIDEAREGESHFQLLFTDENLGADKLNLGLPITLGQPLRIFSSRWPNYEIAYQERRADDPPSKLSMTLARHVFLTEKSPPKRSLIPSLRRTPSVSEANGLNPSSSPRSPRAVGAQEDVNADTSSIALVTLSTFKRSSTFRAQPGSEKAETIEKAPMLIVKVEAIVQMAHRLSGQMMAAYVFTFQSNLTIDGGIPTACVQTTILLEEDVRVLVDQLGERIAVSSAVKDRAYEANNSKSLKGMRTYIRNLMDSIPYSENTLRRIRSFLEQPRLLDDWFLLGTRSMVNSIAATVIDGYGLSAPKRKSAAYKPSEEAAKFSAQLFADGYISTDSHYSSLVARAQWADCWREEFVVVDTRNISFYSVDVTRGADGTWHMQTAPTLVLRMVDIVRTSQIPDSESPLHGYFVMRLETIGRVHYLAFASYHARDCMSHCLLTQMFNCLGDSSPRTGEHSENSAAAAETLYTLPGGNWLPRSRLILNSRDLIFGEHDNNRSRLTASELCALSGKLLQMVFDLDSSSNGSSGGFGALSKKDRLSKYLDEILVLRTIDLSSLDISSVEALCFFVNVYHTLLQHARIVLGAPDKKNWSRFFNTVSYEIGDEVFSLAELEQCVIKGKLSRPAVLADESVPIPASDEHYGYALGAADLRVHLALNNGSMSNPSTVYLLLPETIEAQLNYACASALSLSIQVDIKNNKITVPKVFETYVEDFGSDVPTILLSCRRFLDKISISTSVRTLAEADKGKRPTVVQYLKLRTESHPNMVLAK